MTDADAPAPARFTLYRDARGRFGAAFRRAWAKRWVRILAILAAIPVIFYFLLWLIFARNLPSAESLLTYQPPLPTTVRAIDGEPVHSFARERRVELAFEEYPQVLVDAFTSAEDKTFFEHGGLDYPGVIKAVVNYTLSIGSGDRVAGGSTITQQVAKNLLLGDEYSVTRKIKEAFLARRIERVLSKPQIMELYLNQIFLGRNAYGVQAAARAYFDKDVENLELHEAAYLATLPKAPSNYDPDRRPERAVERRNWILSEMERNEKITAAQRAAAQAMPLGTVRGASASIKSFGGYFMEEVRRQLMTAYGEETEKGANGVYTGGLWVRTSLDVAKQRAAETALRDALMRYERGRGWNDPGKSVDMTGDWRRQLAAANFGVGYDDWRAAVVISKSGASAEIGFVDGSTGTLPASGAAMPKRGTNVTAFSALRPGMIIAVKQEGGAWSLRSIPLIRGGMVAEEVATGRVLAMQGGFDVRGDDFNRATQAMRQPGSTFKPVVYSAALDNGMTPASIIVDGPFCVWQGAGLGQKCFRNFSGGNAGPQTMRWGLEQSRNLMTVRAANQTGMEKITRLAKTLGVGEYPNYLAIALGAGDTTVLKMTNAFAIIANQGREVKPTLIDYIQDRSGKVIYRNDTRCRVMTCNAPDWDGKPMPRPPLRTKQLMDPMTAFQMVHLLEGVIQRGTAQNLRDLKRPIFGKTGTSTGPTNVWFVGGTPDVVAGVYMGFDQPRPMGGYAQGGTLAAPIFKQFAQVAFKDVPAVPFRAPQGIRMVRIDRRSGKKVFGEWPTDEPKAAVIWEAFKPESEPRRSIRRDELPEQSASAAKAVARRQAPRRAKATRDSDFLQNQGGIY
jgi:penicillin-binding protein 1A